MKALNVSEGSVILIDSSKVSPILETQSVQLYR